MTPDDWMELLGALASGALGACLVLFVIPWLASNPQRAEK